MGGVGWGWGGGVGVGGARVAKSVCVRASVGEGGFQTLISPALKAQTQSALCTVVFISSFPAY